MTIAENLRQVRARMAGAAQRAQRSPDEITLVAVSKTKPLALIAETAAAGQVDFGENRVEELWEKSEAAAAAGLDQIRWHAIGTIQSRKAKLALGNFEKRAMSSEKRVKGRRSLSPLSSPLSPRVVLIHAVDRPKIAQRLSRLAAENDQQLDLLLEVNVSGEASKHGFSPAGLLKNLPALLNLPALRFCGLMTMAPYVHDAEEVRPLFRQLRTLLQELRRTFPPAQFQQATWQHLSMGMTSDFEVAIEEGATIVRVGTAIFGHREYE